MTPFSALSMIVDADLTGEQYRTLSNISQTYPCYSIIKRVKKDCYPPKMSYKVTNNYAQVNLQVMLDHTITRLLTSLKGDLSSLTAEDRNSLQLICKWSCDGLQKPQFESKMQSKTDDQHIFQSSLVPVQLLYGNNKKLWLNPNPSSLRYCRPIRIRFVDEAVDVTQDEIKHVENAINHLQNTTISIDKNTYSVKHTLKFITVDANVCHSSKDAETTKCYICGATPKEFNNLTTQEVHVDTLPFGLSIYHIGIRLFQNILQLAYKLPVKKWQITSEADKAIVNENKQAVHQKLRRELEFHMDALQTRFHNTYDCYMAREFFSYIQSATDATDIDWELIKRCANILITLQAKSEGHKVHLSNFADYCNETAKLYVRLYPWHPMTLTTHMILVHGATIVEKAFLPFGLLSDEAMDVRDEYFKKAARFSREGCNRSVLDKFLLKSDPLITSMMQYPSKDSLPSVKNLIILPEPNSDDSDSDEA